MEGHFVPKLSAFTVIKNKALPAGLKDETLRFTFIINTITVL